MGEPATLDRAEPAGMGKASEAEATRSSSIGVFLVVSNLETPFVSIDYEILQSCYQTDILIAQRGVGGVLEVVRRSFSAGAGLGWFASWHTFVFTCQPIDSAHTFNTSIIRGYPHTA